MKNLSIIIPHYQKQNTLIKVIEALQPQIHINDEIIIVDDHSPNGVPPFHCSQLKIIKPPKHIPHIYRLNTIRNYGIKHAVNDGCIILDADCVPQEEFITHARKIYDPSILFTAWIKHMDKTGFVGEGIRSDWEIPWIDKTDRGCMLVKGGCMYFSKQRAKLVGLFDVEFDGTWGYGENVFASACYHSGMRLRFEKELIVHHQWHKPTRVGTTSNNRHLLTKKRKLHKTELNLITPYKPITMVLVMVPNNPNQLEQKMRNVFRCPFPLKVRLINNGNQLEQHEEATMWWRDRWAVDYINYKNKCSLSKIKNDALKECYVKNYEHLIMYSGEENQ